MGTGGVKIIDKRAGKRASLKNMGVPMKKRSVIISCLIGSYGERIGVAKELMPKIEMRIIGR